MNVIKTVGVLVLAQALAPGAIRGQDSSSLPIGELSAARVPVHTAASDRGHDYGIWAAGAGYKASFHDGMTFVPYLGADYPVSRSWSWRTTAVRFGTRRVVAEQVECQHAQFEYRYEYDLGGVVEAYDVRADGLEQTFVIAEPLGDGDLVITGRIDTALQTPAAMPGHQSLVFRDSAGLAIVEYGAAWVIDAGGNQAAITTAFAGDEITLRVPGSWLANASYPVTVDPLLTPVNVVVGSSLDIYRVAIGHEDESAADNTMLLFDRSASSGDTDLYGYITDADLSGTHTVFADITASWKSLDPACAYVGGADTWAVVFRRHFVNGSPQSSLLRSHLHPRASTSYSTGVGFLPTPSPFNDATPEVGGCASGSLRTHAVVVFERENNGASGGDYAPTNRTEVHYALLDCTVGNGTFGTAQWLGGGGSTDCQDPAVTVGPSNGEDWLVAFSIILPSAGTPDWEVWARKIASNGAATPQVWTSPRSADSSVHEFAPAIGGRDGRYLISFTAGFGSGAHHAPSSGRESWAQRVEWAVGTTAMPASLPPVLLATDIYSQMRTTDVAFDSIGRSHFVATWLLGLTPGSGVYAARLGYDGLVTEGPLTVTPSTLLGDPACAFDATTRNFLLTWSGDVNLTGRVLEYVTAAAISNVTSACSNATLRWDGSQQIGFEFGRVLAKKPGGDNGTLHFLVASLATANQPMTIPGVVPGCSLLVDNVNGYLGALGLRFGKSVTWDFPLPSWLDATTFHFQDWILDGPEFEASESLSVPVVK